MFCSSHHLREHHINSLFPGDSKLDQLVQVVLARFHHHTLLFFLHFLFFGSQSPSPIHTQVSRNSYMYYLELFCKKDFFLPTTATFIYLISHFFLIAVWTHAYLLHILSYKPTLHYLLSRQI